MIFLKGEGENLAMCVCVCGGRVGGTDMLSFCSHFAVISHTWIDNSLVDEVCTQKGRHFLKSVT